MGGKEKEESKLKGELRIERESCNQKQESSTIFPVSQPEHSHNPAEPKLSKPLRMLLSAHCITR